VQSLSKELSTACLFISTLFAFCQSRHHTQRDFRALYPSISRRAVQNFWCAITPVEAAELYAAMVDSLEDKGNFEVDR